MNGMIEKRERIAANSSSLREGGRKLYEQTQEIILFLLLPVSPIRLNLVIYQTLLERRVTHFVRPVRFRDTYNLTDHE